MALSADSHEGETLKADYTRRSCCDAWADGGSIPPTSTILHSQKIRSPLFLPAEIKATNSRSHVNGLFPKDGGKDGFF